MSVFDALPNDIVRTIVSPEYLPIQIILRVSRCNKRLHKVITDESFWSMFAYKYLTAQPRIVEALDIKDIQRDLKTYLDGSTINLPLKIRQYHPNDRDFEHFFNRGYEIPIRTFLDNPPSLGNSTATYRMAIIYDRALLFNHVHVMNMITKPERYTNSIVVWEAVKNGNLDALQLIIDDIWREWPKEGFINLIRPSIQAGRLNVFRYLFNYLRDHSPMHVVSNSVYRTICNTAIEHGRLNFLAEALELIPKDNYMLRNFSDEEDKRNPFEYAIELGRDDMLRLLIKSKLTCEDTSEKNLRKMMLKHNRTEMLPLLQG